MRSQNYLSQSSAAEDALSHALDPHKDERIEIYVDGSWGKLGERPDKSLIEVAGWGFVVVAEDVEIHSDCGVIRSPISRQIDGEAGAVLAALAWAKDNGFEYLRFYHDYLGLSRWVQGIWRPKSRVAIKYVAEFSGFGIHALWTHVKGHSDDKWNDRADALAKEAVKRVR